MLARRELRQLSQRVTARYHLAPLGRAETEEYVRHRLRVAGGEGKVLFTQAALAVIHHESGGVPRLVNLICDRALLAGYVQSSRTIGAGMVGRAASEVRGETSRPRWRIAAALAVGWLAALAGLLLWRGDSAARSASAPSSAVARAEAHERPAPVHAAAATQPLDPLLLTRTRPESLARSLAEVQALWGTGPLLQTSLRTHLEQLQRLDLPAVLEMFHPARRDTCFVALLAIEGDAARLGDGNGGSRRIALRELDRLWTRQAIFLWRDAVGGAPDAPSALAFARETLAGLGYLTQADEDLAAAVAAFQHDAELTPDGVIGSRTLMALYSRGPFQRPRLSGSAS
jgi:general secretion pathway protein A